LDESPYEVREDAACVHRIITISSYARFRPRSAVPTSFTRFTSKNKVVDQFSLGWSPPQKQKWQASLVIEADRKKDAVASPSHFDLHMWHNMVIDGIGYTRLMHVAARAFPQVKTLAKWLRITCPEEYPIVPLIARCRIFHQYSQIRRD